jgi:hypothetical protein
MARLKCAERAVSAALALWVLWEIGRSNDVPLQNLGVGATIWDEVILHLRAASLPSSGQAEGGPYNGGGKRASGQFLGGGKHRQGWLRHGCCQLIAYKRLISALLALWYGLRGLGASATFEKAYGSGGI